MRRILVRQHLAEQLLKGRAQVRTNRRSCLKARVERLEGLARIMRGVDGPRGWRRDGIGPFEARDHPLLKLASLIVEQRARGRLLDLREMRCVPAETLAGQDMLQDDESAQ